MNQEYRLFKKIDEIINYYSYDEIHRNELIFKKHNKVRRFFNYMDHLLIGISEITGCVSNSLFASLSGVTLGITSSTIELKICWITAGIYKYKSINEKKKHGKIVLLVKSKLNTIEVLLSEDLVDSDTSHDEFVSINNSLKEFYNIKEEVKNSNNK